MKDAERRFTLHVLPFFTGRKAAEIGTDHVRKYIAQRQGEGAENATINRELALLKRAFSLAMKNTPPKVTFRPHVPMLAEDNTRSGFFERAQFEAVRARLFPALQPLVAFMFLTGWRIREVLTLHTGGKSISPPAACASNPARPRTRRAASSR